MEMTDLFIYMTISTQNLFTLDQEQQQSAALISLVTVPSGGTLAFLGLLYAVGLFLSNFIILSFYLIQKQSRQLHLPPTTYCQVLGKKKLLQSKISQQNTK